MKPLGLLLLFVTQCVLLLGGSDPREELRSYEKLLIIPEVLEYDPPEPFFRARPYNNEIAKPEFYHPKNGGYELSAEIKFSKRPVGVWIGEGKRLFQKPVFWDDLKQEIQKVGSAVEGSVALTEVHITGCRVLLLDYRQHLHGGAPWPEFFITKAWFPIDEHLVIEGHIVCSSETLRAALRERLLSMKIHKWKQLEQSADPSSGTVKDTNRNQSKYSPAPPLPSIQSGDFPDQQKGRSRKSGLCIKLNFVLRLAR